MKRIARLVVLIGLLATPAAAKDVCIQHADTRLVLSKVKIPKPGASVPLVGFYTGSGTPPFVGSITHLNNSLILVAGTYFVSGTTCFERVYVDESFNGLGMAECTNNLGDDFEVVWTPLDCANVSVP